MKTLLPSIAVLIGAIALGTPVGRPAEAASHGQKGTPSAGMMAQHMVSPGLMMPSMDAERGKKLFASKGCVVCHSINGVGGEDAPPLDASTMPMPMSPFEFSAKMWRGAEAMVALQREELGEPIELSGQDLADIVAFVHHAEVQKEFSDADIPPRVKDLMGHMGGEEMHEKGAGHKNDGKKD
jgi:cytochrome c